MIGTRTFTLAQMLDLRESHGEPVDPTADPAQLVEWAHRKGWTLVNVDWIAVPVNIGMPWLIWSSPIDWPEWPEWPEGEDAQGLPVYGWEAFTAAHGEVVSWIDHGGSIVNGRMGTLRIIKSLPGVTA